MAALDLKRSARRGLRPRIVHLTMAGTLGPIALLGWLSWSSVRTLESQVLEERQQLAITVAAYVDPVVNLQIELLEKIWLAPGAGGPRVEPAALREAYVRSRFLTGDFLLDRSGQVMQAESAGAPLAGPPKDLPAVREALEKGVPQFSGLSTERENNHLLFLLVPLRNAQSQVVGIIGGEIDPESSGFRGLLNFMSLGANETADLVDRRGVVIASTEAGRLCTESDHRQVLAELIERRSPAVGTCHGCHQSGQAEQRVDEVMAFAPLPSRASWGISIRQRKAQAFSAAAALRWKMLVLAPAPVLLSLLFAVGAASSIAAPLCDPAGDSGADRQRRAGNAHSGPGQRRSGASGAGAGANAGGAAGIARGRGAGARPARVAGAGTHRLDRAALPGTQAARPAPRQAPREADRGAGGGAAAHRARAARRDQPGDRGARRGARRRDRDAARRGFPRPPAGSEGPRPADARRGSPAELRPA